MSTSDLIEFFGWLFAAWSLGFAGGYAITNFIRGVNQVS